MCVMGMNTVIIVMIEVQPCTVITRIEYGNKCVVTLLPMIQFEQQCIVTV